MMIKAGYNGKKKQYKDYMVLKVNNIIKKVNRTQVFIIESVTIVTISTI